MSNDDYPVIVDLIAMVFVFRLQNKCSQKVQEKCCK